MKLQYLLVALILSSFSLSAAAANHKPAHKAPLIDVDPKEAETGPSLNAGDRFQVVGYDPATRTYKLVLLADDTAGPLVAAPEDLAKAVRQLSLQELLNAPYSIVSSDSAIFEYTVDEGKELTLLTDEQITARRHR